MIKKFISISIENKSLNHILFIFLLLLAFISYNKIPKEMFPPNTLDMISVKGHYSGANSTILDKLIVQDIESILQNNQNLTDIQTIITNGTFHINAEIKDKASKQQIVNNIKNSIENLKQDLPKDMDIPTVDILESYFPLINISISSNTNKEYIEVAKDLTEDIKKLKNLYSVTLDGDYSSLLVISLNQQKLIAYGISNEKAYNALMGLYSLYPIGSISSKKQKYYVESKNDNIDINTLLESEIKIDDKLIYVKNIADIKYDYENRDVITRTDAARSVIINIKKAKLGDSIELSKKITKIITTYQDNYQDIDFKVLSDSSFWIKTRLNTIGSNIIIGLILLFFSIWFFISLKIAIVVILGIPVSFAFGLIGLDFFGGSLNTLSMIGVLLSLGILVDEAIVVSENIHRHSNMGKSIKQACIDGTNEMMPILFASMLTTIIAFLPLAMLSGGLGVFIKIIPLIVIILVISSFVESFIFLPLHYKELSFKFLNDRSGGIRERMWNKLSVFYMNSLSFFIKRRYIWGFAIVFFTLFATYNLAKSSVFQLFPEFDAMTINLIGKVKNGAINYTLQETKELEKILIKELDSENVASISTIIGMNSDGRSMHEKGNNLFTLTINLKQKKHEDFFNRVINPIFAPYKEPENSNRTRILYAKEIQHKIESLIQKHNLKENFLEFSINIPQTGVVKNDVEISLSHKDNIKIKNSLESLQEAIKKIQGVHSIKDDMKYDELKAEITLNTFGNSLGFTQKIIISKVRNFISMQKLSKIVDTNAELIELRVDFSNHDNLYSLYNLSLEVPNQSYNVCLKDIAIVSFSKDITTIKKDDLQKIFTLSASFDKDKISSRVFYQKLKPTIQMIKKSGVEVFIKGEQKTNNQIKKDIFVSLLFALFGILIILTWLFSSLGLSFFALSVIPLSILGVLIGHKIMGMDISFSSLLGFVGLIGIVINDTLIMLSMIKKSKNTDELLQNASLRVRPILLTSITTIVGLSTLIFFASGESLLMQPLAVSIGFGLIYATIINLYYLPILYSFKNRYNNR
ncbi:efflux RND transporter permease subunit [Sulfurimonas sp.]|uniref:efflux RND transporter permease subunit n=1 Tax=Sulfurimonas sp. TaxID=2022749 RepID=UPI002B48F7F9|nr:efflux RND transporter permease subunit [Sulfurimonas sp.]